MSRNCWFCKVINLQSCWSGNQCDWSLIRLVVFLSVPLEAAGRTWFNYNLTAESGVSLHLRPDLDYLDWKVYFTDFSCFNPNMKLKQLSWIRVTSRPVFLRCRLARLVAPERIPAFGSPPSCQLSGLAELWVFSVICFWFDVNDMMPISSRLDPFGSSWISVTRLYKTFLSLVSRWLKLLIINVAFSLKIINQGGPDKT